MGKLPIEGVRYRVPVTVSKISNENFNLLSDWKSGSDIKYLQIQGHNRSIVGGNLTKIEYLT